MDSYNTDIIPDPSVPALQDSVSSIAWANNSATLFGLTTWDGCVRIFQVVNTNYNKAALTQRFEYKFQQPAMKCTFLCDNSQILVGLANGAVRGVDLNTNAVSNIANHTSAISSMHMMSGQNVLITTGYDENVFFWQLGNPTPSFTLNLQNKVFTTDYQTPILVAAMANERIGIIDINYMNSKSIIQPLQFLGKHSQLQSIAINNKCTAFGLGSIDGRANISNLCKSIDNAPKPNYGISPNKPNALYNPKPIIVFKSNKKEEGGNTIMYPVNSVGFSPVKDKWFMTAGSDGYMHFWDFQARNKIKTLSYGEIPITVAKVSPSGDKIAYGLGNDWHIGQEGMKWSAKIGVHLITEQQSRFAVGK